MLQLIKDKVLLKNILISGINISIILLVLNLLSLNLFICESAFVLISSIFLLLGMIIFNLHFKEIFKKLIKSKETTANKTLIGIILIIFSFVLLLVTKSQMIWFVSIPIMLSGLDIALQSINIKRKELQMLSVASFIYALFFIFVQTIPSLWYIIQQFSLTFTNTIGSIIGQPLLLGPSISGLWTLITFLIFSITVFFLTGMKRKILFIINKVGLLICWIIYIAIIGFADFEANSNIMDYHYILFILCFIPTFFYLSKVVINFETCQTPTFKRFNIKNVFKNGATWALVLLLISSVAITTFPATGKAEDEETHVLFYGQNMLGSWDVPEYGKYGRQSSGMFGLVPYYLSLSGYKTSIVVDNETKFMDMNFPSENSFAQYENLTETIRDNETDILNMTTQANNTITRLINFTDYTTIIDSQEITKEILDDVDVFVVINLNETFSTDEHNVIWNFVKNGGSLLVLGDHTDISGMQGSLNTLLKPAGISYRFDSALPIDSDFKWETCYHFMHNPVTNKLDKGSVSISVGASLDIGTGSFPMIIGRYGLSDKGDRLNSERAYLGDYEYNKGEQIGDVILAAGAYYGSGRVMVFGDTSSYQNSAISSSLPMLHGVFNWLSSSRAVTLEYAQVIIPIIMFLAAAIIYLKSKKDKITFAIFPIVLCIALVLSTFLNPILIEETEIKGNIIYIDSSHIERFNLQLSEGRSLSGFMLNMMRNDYLPIMMGKFSDEKMQNSDIVVFNAPTKKFSGSEVNSIIKYIEGGGIVILATGFDDKAASMPLLNEFGLDIEDIPLGPVPYVEEDPEFFQKAPRFVDSWPIEIQDKTGFKTEIFYSINISETQFVLMTLTRYDNETNPQYEDYTGGLLLISDSQFLLDENIESLYDYWPGNIQFLKNIIDELKDKEVLK